MENNYFFVDGSALLADVARFQRSHREYEICKLDIVKFANYFTGRDFEEFHSGAYRRFVLYFVSDDPRVGEMLKCPDPAKPGSISDMHLEYCGKRISRFKKVNDWLESKNAPQYVRECLYRSEKAVDTQICCDALQLAAMGRLDRLFLYSNDFDFVPLCRTLRQLGCNINLFRLYDSKVNKSLAQECDAYHVMEETVIKNCFVDAGSGDAA